MDGQFIIEKDCMVRKQQFLERKCVKGCKNPLQGGFMREIRRCGKSYLLNNIFFHHLLDNGVDADHIIRFAFDSADDLYLIGESLIQIEKESGELTRKNSWNIFAPKSLMKECIICCLMKFRCWTALKPF